MIKKIIINISIAIIVCIALTIVADTILPVFNNDMALDQLENDNMSYVTWSLWTHVPGILTAIKIITCLICGWNIFRTVNTYINTQKMEI